MKRSFSVHSSETDEYVTPRKRARRDINSPCPSENTPASCRSMIVVKVAPRKAYNEPQEVDLCATLRRCRSEADPSAIKELKALPYGKPLVQHVQSLLHVVKTNVKKRVDKTDRIIETELYLKWLEELDSAVIGIENLLSAKIPGTRRRVPGLGYITFVILYRIMDGFISDVDHHHDGWSSRGSEDHPIYPITMTLAEEAKDPSTDSRAESAVHFAEDALGRYDRVMGVAVRRLKAEGGRSLRLARMVAQTERALARACCLLCEQTGFGGDKSATGESILRSTRTFMRQWKAEHGITDDDEYDTQDGF
ncbi:hypothetical protein P691DRAFT_793628 [Macrolepiota fuliginosa MF-IS2]|uniref:Uncharacterized protein n=1 Tax=Macrolepiota fuliginosa MF-IS2 TaxID=1400762 RepID=A0A9P5XAW3_9AGAR|nr:hypothetical protein P691DRAFT_793628 [Macrolepiota fuliginosa MF-IS2]